MSHRCLSVPALTAILMSVFANASFCADESTKGTNASSGVKVAKVTGIGGVFIKAKNNQKALAEWYQKNLGVKLEDWGGAILNWKDDKAEDGGVTVWHAVEKDSDLFKPSESGFMINYRIDNMDAMLAQLRANGVKTLKGPESHENGKFLWLLDPDGNKVELWEAKIWDDKNKSL